jgi:hypothetical protein
VASGVDATAASYASSSSEELITSWAFVLRMGAFDRRSKIGKIGRNVVSRSS